MRYIFQTLSAEGDLLTQRGSSGEAILVYSKALEIRPEDKHVRIARGKCQLAVGNPTLALVDAEETLKIYPDFPKGMFLKAEALYAQSDFESALINYHRGHRLRPEDAAFRIGIQKTMEAINNSIGDSSRRIRVPEILSKNWTAFHQHTGERHVLLEKILNSNNLSGPMEQKLLGQIYEDKVYLAGLENDATFVDFPDEKIKALVVDGLRYLSSRLEFWKQENPLYARRKAKKVANPT